MSTEPRRSFAHSWKMPLLRCEKSSCKNRGIVLVPPAPQILQKGRIHYPHPFSSETLRVAAVR